MDTSVNILTYIVDDDEDIELEIRDFLQLSGIRNFKFYHDYKVFLAQLNADINICVIDHTLPGATGLDVIKSVKDKNKFSYVIIFSGQTNHNVTKMYINSKADAYVDKNDKNYKEVLVGELKKGFLEAMERVEFVKFLELKYAAL